MQYVVYCTYVSPNHRIPARKCERRFELQQTHHKIYTTCWGFETTLATVLTHVSPNEDSFTEMRSSQSVLSRRFEV